MRVEDGQTIFLKDYAPSPYLVERVELDVTVNPGVSSVRALLTIVPRDGTTPGTPACQPAHPARRGAGWRSAEPEVDRH